MVDWAQIPTSRINFRQFKILQWAANTFGPVAHDRRERLSRVVEEAIEVAQAGGLSKDAVTVILERAYSRPVGEMRNEIGGLGVTLYALAESLNICAEACIQEEIERVVSLPADHWQRKHAEKVAAGTAVELEEERHG